MDIKNSAFEYFNSRLTDDEKENLKTFASSETADVVKRILLEELYIQGLPPSKEDIKSKPRNFVFGLDPNGIMPDEAFGRAVRVHIEAVILVEQVFKTIQNFAEKKPASTPTGTNRAR